MSNTKKPTGIIYRAYNTVSQKSYVGKTVRGLSIRKKEHLKKADSQLNYKFANALRLYPESTWEWSVLIEVEVDKLDEYEQLFIKDLDTLDNGYNTFLNNYSVDKKHRPCYDPDKVYELYHHEYGQISGTRDELRQINAKLVDSLSMLISGKKCKTYKGWILLENKDTHKYKQVKNILTLRHPELGTHTLSRKEFKKQFKLPSYGLSRLALKTRKSWCKWTLIEEN